jgi:hypothetical protein
VLAVARVKAGGLARLSVHVGSCCREGGDGDVSSLALVVFLGSNVSPVFSSRSY